MNAMEENMLKFADSAVAYAQQVRTYHARRTKRGNLQRETDITVALERLQKAMKPVRSELSRCAILPQTNSISARRGVFANSSKAIQAERRKLWKMQRRDDDA